MRPYPVTWPTPDPKRPDALVTRITEAQKLALYNRQITTRALAKELGVHEQYLSYKFPHKVPVLDKRDLVQARKEYKLAIAKRVIAGEFTTKKAATLAHVSYNTMTRFVAKARLEREMHQALLKLSHQEEPNEL